MPNTLIQSLVSALQKERGRLEDELHRITTALAAFGNAYRRGGKPKVVIGTGKKRTMSAAGRKRIAEAQKRRWAKVRAGKR